ncbi:MAG: hypothetical protein AB9873_01330 [Syntrophobacteraceae bacterium]
MKTNHGYGSGKLSLVMAMAVTMTITLGASGAYASIDVTGNKGWDPSFSPWGSVGSGLENTTASSSTLSGDESLYARKGRKGGVKFEHGRPGHAAASPEGAVYARKGRPKPERRG